MLSTNTKLGLIQASILCSDRTINLLLYVPYRQPDENMDTVDGVENTEVGFTNLLRVTHIL